ncbi:hypothetical protein [Agrobacterium cavarae]|uniref:hypothetical protein n=1 Tax=Agrobacterium cavarae TaxID=2528239 RepID=UPI002FF80B9F
MAAIWYSGYASSGSGYSAKWLLAIPLLALERGGVLLDAPRTLIFFDESHPFITKIDLDFRADAPGALASSGGRGLG